MVLHPPKIFNPQQIETLFPDAPSVIAKFLNMSIEHLEEKICHLEEAISNSNWKAVHTNSHSIKSVGKQCGAQYLSDTAKYLEKNAIRLTDHEILESFDVIKAAYAELKPQISAYQQSLL